MKRSVTLIEVIVGALILASVFGGLMASFVAARRYVKLANQRLVAANLARSALDRLYLEVREDTWNAGGRLLPGGPYNVNNLSVATAPIENITYSGNYSVANVTGRQYRQATVNITYPLP